MGRTHRTYSDDEKAVALTYLEVNKGDVARTSKQTGIPTDTLYVWSKGKHVHPDVLNLQEQRKEALDARMELMAYTILEALPDKLEGANFRDAAVGLGIVVDKMQVLRGLASNITENRGTSTHTERLEAVFAVLTGADDRGGVQPALSPASDES